MSRTYNKVFRVDDATDHLVRDYAKERDITPNEAIIKLASRPVVEATEPVLSPELEKQLQRRAQAKGVTREEVLAYALSVGLRRLDNVDRYEGAKRTKRAA